MALLKRISVFFYFAIFFIVIPNSSSSYELIREKRNPTIGILSLCTEEKMQWKFTCILCKGHDPSCYLTSTTQPLSTSTTIPSSLRVPSSTTSTTAQNSTPAGEE